MPQLRLLVLKTSQAETLRGFYTKLGFQFIEEQHGKGPLHYSASLGDGILEIYPLPVGSETDSSTQLGFAVADFASIIESFAGLTHMRGPTQTEWGLRAVLCDPDGRSVELYETN